MDVIYFYPGCYLNILYACNEIKTYFVPCRKKSILLSHVFVFIGAALCAACQAAAAPELLMIGRFFFGVNNGKLLMHLN